MNRYETVEKRKRPKQVEIPTLTMFCSVLILVAVIENWKTFSKQSKYYDILHQLSVSAATYNRYHPTYRRYTNNPRTIAYSQHSKHTYPSNTGILLAQTAPPLPNDYPISEEEGTEASASPMLHQHDDYAQNLYKRYLQHWEENSSLSDDEDNDQVLDDYDDSDSSYIVGDDEVVDAMSFYNRDDSNDNEDLNTAVCTTAQPIVYRYFGRHQINNSMKREYIPFIILGPSVGHWQAIGELLSSKGYSVMACEVQPPAVDGTLSEEGTEAVVTAVLKAMRWRQAVVVGCDFGNVVALKAALKLSSHSSSTTSTSQVAGLVLTGDLTEVSQFVRTLIHNNQTAHHHHKPRSETPVDSFLKSFVPCPSVIVWDGDLHSLPNLGGSTRKNTLSDFTLGELQRVTILGSGTAPHRRSPEHFSWVLARFVEENFEVASTSTATAPLQTRGGYARRRGLVASFTTNNEWVRALLSEDGLAVTGRLFAIPFLCIIGAKVVQFHYNRSLSVLSTCHAFALSQRHAIMFIAKIVSNDWKRKNSFMRSLFAQAASFGGVRWRNSKKNAYDRDSLDQEKNIMQNRLDWNPIGILDYEQVST